MKLKKRVRDAVCACSTRKCVTIATGDVIRKDQMMKLLLENWREFLEEDKNIEFLLENSPIGDISPPIIQNENATVYDFRINDNEYIVKLIKRSHGAPREVSFNVKGAESYELTGKGEVFTVINSVIAIIKDFISKFPEEKSFQFTGAGSAPLAPGIQSRRTQAYIALLKRAIKKDSELDGLIKSMGDLGWANEPNTFKINLMEYKK